VAIETGGIWHIELVQEIGSRTANITGDARASTFLFQQLSVALQWGNAVSFQNTFTASWIARCNPLFHFLLNFNDLVPTGFLLVSQ